MERLRRHIILPLQYWGIAAIPSRINLSYWKDIFNYIKDIHLSIQTKFQDCFYNMGILSNNSCVIWKVNIIKTGISLITHTHVLCKEKKVQVDCGVVTAPWLSPCASWGPPVCLRVEVLGDQPPAKETSD